MQRYKYRAINVHGRPVRGTLSAINEADLYNQLQTAGMELIQCSSIDKNKGGLSLSGSSRIKLRDMIQLFVHLEQMQSAGIPLLDALSDIRDGSETDQMRDMMSDIHRDVQEGAAFSEALAQHPKVFKPLYISLVQAGEDTGSLTSSYKQLVRYLKWVDEMQAKVKKATRYPMVVTVVVILVVIFMMSYLVPQIVDFLKYLDLELPWFTVALINTSNFFVNPQFTVMGIPVYGSLIVILAPLMTFFSIFMLRKFSDDFAYQLDSLYLKLPVFGGLIRKITIARYAQTFGALFASGIDVIKGLQASRNTVTNRALIDAMSAVETYVQAGSTLSDALNNSGEFPSMVVRMVRVGEESGNLSVVLDQVSEFYTKDVDAAIDGMIEMIQPMLTVILASIIIWIAAGSFGPIYMNLGNMVDF